MGSAAGAQAAPEDDRQSQIGRRLRERREAQRLTLAELATRSGLNKGFLSKIERDQAAPSVASLLRLCDALGLEIGELFDGSHDHDLVRAGEYPGISFGGEGMDEALLTPTRERRVQVIHSEIHPGGGSGAEPYRLPVDVEFVFVLAGQLEITLDGRVKVLRAGDALTFASSAAHTFANPSKDEVARVLWVLIPALPADGWHLRRDAAAPETPGRAT